MRITINFDDTTAADLIDEFGAGALLWLYSSTSELGIYNTVTSTLVVSGTERYELNDPAGVPGETWYQFRVEDSVASTYTEWSDPWLADALTAYASVDAVAATLSLGGDTTRYDLIEDMITDVSTALDAACGRQFYRDPQVTGTDTFYLDVTRHGRMSLSLATGGRGFADGKALDIVSLTNLYIRPSESSDYVELTQDTDFYLQAGMGPAGSSWPFEDIALSPVAAYNEWPEGLRAVKVVGVRGFASVPPAVRRAVISETRNRFRAGIAAGAGQSDGQPGPGDETDWLRVMFPPYVKRSYAAI